MDRDTLIKNLEHEMRTTLEECAKPRVMTWRTFLNEAPTPKPKDPERIFADYTHRWLFQSIPGTLAKK